jgi:hypothetical protein
VTDLLAIISHDRGHNVDAGALERFRSDYEALRGAPRHLKAESADWAKVLLIDHSSPDQVGTEREGEGWTAWAGRIASPAKPADTPLAQLDGQFAMVRLEAGGTLTVATDPLGMKPLFMATAQGRTYVSSSALVLARHLRLSPSRPGLEAFLRTGNQFGRDTPWQGVRRFLPAERLTFSPAGRESGQYWQPEVDPRIQSLSFDECADACIELSTVSVRARYKSERPWVDLTGGFDTRLLALLASRAGIEFATNTGGAADSEDAILARQIAATGGWQWTNFGLPRDWDEQLPQQIESAVAWGDCHLDALPLAEVLLGHRQKSETETTLLNGGGGEHFRDYPSGHELLRAGRSKSVSFDRLLAWRVLGPIDLSAFAVDPTPSVAAGLRQELQHRAAAFASAPNTFQNDVLYAFKSTGHFGAYQAVAGSCLHMELPFYSKQVFTGAISAPFRHRAYHRLMREMMFRLDPAIAAIATETGGPAEPLRPGNVHRFAAYPWRRGRRLAGRMRGRLFATQGDGAPSPQLRARGKLIASLRAEGRLDPAKMRSGSLYRPDPLEGLFARAAADPGGVDWNALGRIVTVELALQAVDASVD